LGWDINPQTVPGFLGTSGIILLSPIFAAMYRRLGKRDLALPQKFAIGLFLSASAYGLLFLVCLFTNPSDKISFAWEILSISVFFASSELLISALGVSLMAQLVPDRMRGFAMGTWFITSALGIKLGSYVASLVANNAGKGKIDVVYSASEQIASFEKYQHLFGSIAAFGLACAVIAWLIGGKLTRMIGNN
jgi:POT family proton-dependent oligopeptide transporter